LPVGPVAAIRVEHIAYCIHKTYAGPICGRVIRVARETAGDLVRLVDLKPPVDADG
jgi:hypothetical protein